MLGTCPCSADVDLSVSAALLLLTMNDALYCRDSCGAEAVHTQVVTCLPSLPSADVDLLGTAGTDAVPRTNRVRWCTIVIETFVDVDESGTREEVRIVLSRCAALALHDRGQGEPPAGGVVFALRAGDKVAATAATTESGSVRFEVCVSTFETRAARTPALLFFAAAMR